MAKYEWVEFYHEFAEALLKYKNRRSELVKIIVDSYQELGIHLPTLEAKGASFDDVDPFTTIGLFNRSPMKLANRIKIIEKLGKALDVESRVPTSFDGVPLLTAQNAAFYCFKDSPERKEDDIDNLWRLMDAALQFAKAPSDDAKKRFERYFNLAVQKKGNGSGKSTMALFWIAPETFLSLDSKNVQFIFESGKIPADIVGKLPKIDGKIAAPKYLAFVDGIRDYLRNNADGLANFIDLSCAAWEALGSAAQSKVGVQRDSAGAALADDGVSDAHYWIYAPGHNADKWDAFYKAGVMAIGWGEIGDLRNYDSKDSIKQAMKETYGDVSSYMNDAHATWQFANEMKSGDVVFVKKGKCLIVGRGVVTSDYQFDAKREDEYGNIRNVKWTDKGEWPHPGVAALKTLTDITKYADDVAKLNALFDNGTRSEPPESEYPDYDRADFLADVFMPPEDYDRLTAVLRRKKNVVLQGAPGVGKTFAAKRLAYSMIGKKDKKRVTMVQFHQSYSYEDFVMGFRPSESGFELRKGSFYNVCKEAEIDSDSDYFFIIDEINRGNVSKIFGELFMLIEADKREAELLLPYSDEKFSVPKNVFIIGMMNTADRSLAMLDYALRRRFAFVELKPGFETDGFHAYQKELNDGKFDRTIDVVKALNREIAEDESLGDGFCVGHSFFCNLSKEKDDHTPELRSIVEFELIPLLKEYWFDEPSKVRDWSVRLRNAIK